MESFSHFQNINEVNGGDSVFGGIFTNKSTLDTAIGLRNDSDIGQINSLFDDIKNKKEDVEVEHVDSNITRSKRDVAAENNGNSSIWMIVGVILGVIIILVIIFFVLYRMNKKKSLVERAKTMYSNISNKLSSLRANTKNTVIDED